MASGVRKSSKNGLIKNTPRTIIITLITAFKIIALPIVLDSLSLFLAPKYCETRIPAPIDIPINKTMSRKTRAPLAPMAAKASSPTYFPTMIESTVL